MTNPRIALYSVNFGRYRKEMKYGIDRINHDSKIDYFFYTDDDNVTSKLWKIHKVKVKQPPLKSVLDTYRYNAKYYKYHLPDELKNYDIIIWMDSKVLFWSGILPSYDIIVNKMKNRKISMIKHPDRETAQEEIRQTLAWKLENKTNGKNFLTKIVGNKFKLPLVDTCLIIYQNIENTRVFLKQIFDELMQNGLKRDQNIISYTFEKTHQLQLYDVDLTLSDPVRSARRRFSKKYANSSLHAHFPKKKVALLFWGLTRSLKHTYPSIYKNILHVLEDNGIMCDIFIHTYHVEKYNNIRAGEKTTRMDNAQHEFLPYRSILIDSDERTRKKLNLPKYHSKGDFFKNNYNTTDNSILAFYSKKRLITLMEKTKDEYDFAIFIRPDCYYYQTLPLQHVSLIRKGKIIIPNFHLTKGVNDRFAICHVDDAITYGNAFDELLSYSKKNVIHSETFLSDYIRQKKIKPILVDFFFARIRIDNVMNPNDEIIYEGRTKESFNSFQKYSVYKNIQIIILSLIVFTILGVNILAKHHSVIFQKKVFLVTVILLLSVMFWQQIQ